MSLSFDLQRQINLGDTAEVNAYVFDDNDVPIPQDSITSVKFTIQDPQLNQYVLAGSIAGDGHGYVRFTDTTEYIGEYNALAAFTLTDGQIKSSLCSFEVIDPFNPPVPTANQVIGDLVWRKIEDVFDSDEGGPWLRDMTLNYFTKDKMAEFISEGLFDINQQNPPTNLTADYFVNNGQTTPNTVLVVEATYLAVILHLVASYVEQPTPMNGQVAYEDRRDYIERWLQIYEAEMQRYMRWIALFKRQFLFLGHSKNLVSSKAGRMQSGIGPNVYRTGNGYW